MDSLYVVPESKHHRTVVGCLKTIHLRESEQILLHILSYRSHKVTILLRQASYVFIWYKYFQFTAVLCSQKNYGKRNYIDASVFAYLPRKQYPSLFETGCCQREGEERENSPTFVFINRRLRCFHNILFIHTFTCTKLWKYFL